VISQVATVPGDPYDELLQWLYGLEVSRGWDLKLETVRRALVELGSPERSFPSLHVAGTNGKGSVAAVAEALLRAAGLRTGLYTSPHLIDFCERIRVGERCIPRETVVALAEEVRARTEAAGLDLTFFEFATVLAFLHFARQRVDVAVVEVGLGGRLDATNVVEPRATAITTIGFDHERFLGSTLREIAAEKAGIVKPGVPLAIGRIEGEALETIERIAAERGAPCRRLGREFFVDLRGETFDYRGRRVLRNLRSGLAGRFQVDNAAVALATLEDGGWLEDLSEGAIRAALEGVRWPGRLQVIRQQPLVVVDGAHNPHGVAALAAEIPELAAGRPVRVVFGVLADKRWEEMVERLAPHVVEAIVVPVRERRGEDPERIAAVFRRYVAARTASSGKEALAELLADPARRDEAIVVTGSLFLVGEILKGL
jgi:dihydrofolate synthase/folylpolyglutamate synthase